MTKPETAPTSAPETRAADEAKVPFFARKIGRAELTVRTGVRAGASEQHNKT
ncbi:MAG: hypothetical protein R3B09_24220 [Nannocystaceae bacterium]